MVEPYKPLYSVSEVAEVLMVNSNYVYAEIRAGNLPALQLGRLKIRGIDLELYIENYPVMEPDEAI